MISPTFKNVRRSMSGPQGKVRLCIVLGGHWEAQMGGAQYQAKCLLDALGNHPGFETYYLAQAVPATKERETYRIVQFGAPQPRGSADVIMSLPSLYERLRVIAPDVMYQRCLMPYTGTCAYYASRYRAKFVFHIASDSDLRRPRESSCSIAGLSRRLAYRIGEYGMRNADAVVAQTSDQASMFREKYGFEVTKVVPNFQPPPTEPQLPRDRARLRIIWVGNFKALKRPELFVELAESLVSVPAIEFVMIGRPGGERFADLRQRISQLPNLRFLGELSLERTNIEIGASDLLVTTSVYEGFPNTFIQGWLRGVPALSCAVNPEGCLTVGGAGRLVADMAEMREVVLELHRDRVKLDRLSKRAIAYGHANHLPDKADVLVNLLYELGSGASVTLP